jgi:hypothetical protein
VQGLDQKFKKTRQIAPSMQEEKPVPDIGLFWSCIKDFDVLLLEWPIVLFCFLGGGSCVFGTPGNKIKPDACNSANS